MNWQRVIRFLVSEYHMDYRAALELNPIQIEAILTEKSDLPGRIPFDQIEPLKQHWSRIYGRQ